MLVLRWFYVGFMLVLCGFMLVLGTCAHACAYLLLHALLGDRQDKRQVGKDVVDVFARVRVFACVCVCSLFDPIRPRNGLVPMR